MRQFQEALELRSLTLQSEPYQRFTVAVLSGPESRLFRFTQHFQPRREGFLVSFWLEGKRPDDRHVKGAFSTGRAICDYYAACLQPGE